MTTPHSSSEHSSYTPESWANLVPAPAFRFRPPTPRSKRSYSHALRTEGLRFHSDEAVQNEILRAMRELWVGDEATLQANEARMRAFWETLRQAKEDSTIAVNPDEARAIGTAIERLMDGWEPLRRMNADNLRYSEDAPKVALGFFLAGWSGLDTAFRLQDGQVPLETLDELEVEMDRIDAKAIVDKVDGANGTSFMQLALHALSLMGFGKDEEKNSPSPSQSPGTPDGSTADGSETTDTARSATSGSASKTSGTSTRKRATS